MSNASNAVFLIYASQHAEAALRICLRLRAAGVEVWFDQSELVGGDAWDQIITKEIKACELFMPLIVRPGRKSYSWLFSGFNQRLPIKIAMQAKMMPLDQLRERRFQSWHIALGFRSQQHAESARDRHTHRSGDAAAIAFVDQQETRGALDRQSNRLGFAGIERCFELGHEWSVCRPRHIHPARGTSCVHLFCPWRIIACAHHFTPHRVRHNDFALE